MADGDFNLATLWVSVVPEVSGVGQKIEDAGEDAKRRWTDKVKDFGKTITDDLEKAGSSAKDIFSKAGSDSSKAMEDSFKSSSPELRNITDQIADTVGTEFGKRVGSAISHVPGISDALADNFKAGIPTMHDLADTLGKEVGSRLGQGIGGAIHNLDGVAKEFGLDISGWSGPLDNVIGKAQSLQSDFQKTKDLFTTFTGDVLKDAPGIAGAFGTIGVAIGELAGPLAAAVTAGKALADLVDKIPAIESHFHNPDGSYKSGIDRWISEHGGPIGRFFDPPAHVTPPAPGSPSAGADDLMTNLFGSGAVPPPAGGGGGGGDFYHSTYGSGAAPHGAPSAPPPLPTSPSGVGPSSAPLPIPPTSIVPSGSITGGVSGPADLYAAGGRVGALYALAGAMQGTPYSQALRNDCSGMVSELAAVAVGLPPPPAGERFSTPNEGSWLASHGFQSGMGGPGDLRIGWNPAPGNEGHTAATLPGGEHAEQGGSHPGFLVGAGAAGANDPQFSMHAYLPMRGGSGTQNVQSSSGQMPIGTEHDPIYVTTPSTGGGGGGSPGENAGQQLGQGLLSGLAQSVGLDGSVFGGKSPMDWGAVKMGMGVLNWGLGVAKQHAGAEGGMPMMGGGGGGVGGMLGGLVPGPGAAMSAAALPAGGSRGLGAAAGASGDQNVHYDNSINVSGNTFTPQNPMLQQLQHQQNSRTAGIMGSLPTPPG